MLEASVDVVIVGGGIQGVMLARELSPRYSVALVTGPLRTAETLHSHGFLSAGYQGTDLERMRQARSQTAYWRQAFAREGVPWTGGVVGVHEDAEVARWRAVGLTYEATVLPPLLGGLRGKVYRRVEDVVFNPAAALAALRRPVLPQVVEGRAEAFGHDASGRISWARVHTARGPRRLRTRFVLLAAGASNAALAASLLGQTERTKRCQGLRQLHMLCVRGDLPRISGSLGKLSIVSHPGLWILTYRDHPEPPQSGAVDVSVDPAVIGSVLGRTLDTLASWIGGFDRWAQRHEWALYTGWKAECPSVCQPGECPEPVGPHLDDFRVPNLLAVWPSLFTNAIGAAREASARLGRVLSARPTGSSCREMLELDPPANDLVTRWDHPDLEWLSFERFRDLHVPLAHGSSSTLS